jgi:hypothetical protein
MQAEFMKSTQSKRAQIEGLGHGLQASPATILFGREKAHPIDLAQRAQRVMERR